MMEMPVTHRMSGRSAQKVREGLGQRDIYAEFCGVNKRSHLGEERTGKEWSPKYPQFLPRNANTFQGPLERDKCQSKVSDRRAPKVLVSSII